MDPRGWWNFTGVDPLYLKIVFSRPVFFGCFEAVFVGNLQGFLVGLDVSMVLI